MTLKRLELTEVTLKTGKVIKVHAQEVDGLRKAGLLKGKAPVKKEEKAPGKTKEEKATGKTKVSGNIVNPKKLPVNISHANIHQ